MNSPIIKYENNLVIITSEFPIYYSLGEDFVPYKEPFELLLNQSQYDWKNEQPGEKGIKCVTIKAFCVDGDKVSNISTYATSFKYEYKVGDDIILNGIPCVVMCSNLYNFAASKYSSIGTYKEDTCYEWGAEGIKIDDRYENNVSPIPSERLGSGLDNSNFFLEKKECLESYFGEDFTVWEILRLVRKELNSDLWFIPSLEEVEYIYRNKEYLKEVYTSPNDIKVKDGRDKMIVYNKKNYWSSSEHSKHTSWLMRFDDSKIGEFDKGCSRHLHSLRLCRAF